MYISRHQQQADHPLYDGRFALNVIFLICCLSIVSGCRKTVVEIKGDNGVIKEKYEVNKAQEKDGIYQAWNSDGSLFEQAHYKNGKLTGERILYYRNGNPEIIELYDDNGQLHGTYRTFYENGAIKAEKTYVRNMLQGIAKTYYQDGKLKEEVIFTDNSENGPFIEYHPNGKVKWKGTYLNGDNEFGLLEEFDSTGTLIKKMMCDSQAVCRTIWKIDLE